MNIIDVLGPVTKGQKEVAGELKDFLLEAAKIGAEAAKDFKIDVALLPQLQKFADTLNLPVTVVMTAVGGDLVHVVVAPSITPTLSPTLNPELKAGGIA
jgi:hypothetical protein